MNAREIAHHLRGKRNGSHGWLVRCPAHDDHSPSLSIKDSPTTGKLMVKCFGNCDGRDVIAAFKEMGLLGPLSDVRPAPVNIRQIERDTRQLADAALRIWRESQPATGTLVENYLRSRDITFPIPDTIRFHPRLYHQDTKTHLPAMVAAIVVAPSQKIVAILRTYLREHGSGKADLDRNKIMLGPALGGATRLAPAAERMQVAEGIENAFSAMEQNGLPTWAGLTASGVQGMILPPLPLAREVVIAADNDKPRDHYPRGHGYGVAEAAAERWRAEGRSVEIVLPPGGVKGFNDVRRRVLVPQP